MLVRLQQSLINKGEHVAYFGQQLGARHSNSV